MGKAKGLSCTQIDRGGLMVATVAITLPSLLMLTTQRFIVLMTEPLKSPAFERLF